MIDRYGYEAACKLLNINPYHHPYLNLYFDEIEVKLNYGLYFVGVFNQNYRKKGVKKYCLIYSYEVFFNELIIEYC